MIILGVSFCGTRVQDMPSPSVENDNNFNKMTKGTLKFGENKERFSCCLKRNPSLTDCLDGECDSDAKNGVLRVTTVSIMKKNVSMLVNTYV